MIHALFKNVRRIRFFPSEDYFFPWDVIIIYLVSIVNSSRKFIVQNGISSDYMQDDSFDEYQKNQKYYFVSKNWMHLEKQTGFDVRINLLEQCWDSSQSRNPWPNQFEGYSFVLRNFLTHLNSRNNKMSFKESKENIANSSNEIIVTLNRVFRQEFTKVNR